MKNLFFKTITIQNYKCFEDQNIVLNTPDNINEGSGLNILIGENGNGKTSILETINFLTQSTYSTENKLSINDFYDKDKSIIIKAQTEEFNCKMPYPGNYFECNGIEFEAKNRERKSPGKLLSSAFVVNNQFMNLYENYKNSKNADSGSKIQELYKFFNNENIIDGELNVFLFDKNRTRHISTGTFKTTFDRVCEDLNWKFAKQIDQANIDKIVDNIAGEYFKNVIDITQKGTGLKLANDLVDFFDNKDYVNIKIELLDLLHPFTNAFFALREDKELKQIKTKELGSGIEMILTIFLLRSIAGESKGSIIYLIDEPELHLHPKAQEKLLELLLKESKDKQIILSTHSPYIFKNCLNKNVGLIILKRDNSNKILVDNANLHSWGNFPWSPSWGEINYYAYNLPTIEFHNELFGYIQEISQNYSLEKLDDYFVTIGLTKEKKWIKLNSGKPDAPKDCTLPVYIRNCIHHPENTLNDLFDSTELNKSIELLLRIVSEINNTPT